MRRRLVVKYRLHRVSNSRAAALTQPESRAAAGLVKRTTREDVEAEPINKKPTTEKHGVLTPDTRTNQVQESLQTRSTSLQPTAGSSLIMQITKSSSGLLDS